MEEEEAEEEEEGEVALEVEVNRMDFVDESSLCDSGPLSRHQDASRMIQAQAFFSRAEVNSVQATKVHLFRRGQSASTSEKREAEWETYLSDQSLSFYRRSCVDCLDPSCHGMNHRNCLAAEENENLSFRIDEHWQAEAVKAYEVDENESPGESLILVDNLVWSLVERLIGREESDQPEVDDKLQEETVLIERKQSGEVD